MFSQLVTPFRSPFPFDVMASIISKLEPSAQSAFSLVNREYNDEVNRLLWRSFEITAWPNGGTDPPADPVAYTNKLCTAILRCPQRARHVKCLKINLIWVPAHALEVVFPRISQVLASLPNITHLDVRFRGMIDTSALFTNPVDLSFRLTTFELIGGRPIDLGLQEFLTTQPHITSFTMLGAVRWQLDFSPTMFPDLRHVSLPPTGAGAVVPGRPVCSVKVQCPYALLSRSEMLELVEKLCQSTAQMLELTLDFKYEDLDLRHLSESLPALKFLQLARPVQGLELESLPSFPNLQLLWCNNCPRRPPRINPEKMALWTTKCPSLHTIIYDVQDNRNGTLTHFIRQKDFDGSWLQFSSRKEFRYEHSREQYCTSQVFLQAL